MSNNLNIVWTSGERDVALKMVFMYANNSKIKKWWNEINIIIWGPSQKLLIDDIEVQDTFKKILKSGVTAEACIACSEMYGITQQLINMDIIVQSMGFPLTVLIKNDEKIITF